MWPVREGGPHEPCFCIQKIIMTYSSSLAMNQRRYNMAGGGRNQNSVSFRGSERALGPISNTILLIVLACLLGLLYLTQVTKTNAFGYTINELQTKQASLQEEHDELQVASARLQSLDRVKNSAVATTLTPVTPVGTVN